MKILVLLFFICTSSVALADDIDAYAVWRNYYGNEDKKVAFVLGSILSMENMCVEMNINSEEGYQKCRTKYIPESKKEIMEYISALDIFYTKYKMNNIGPATISSMVKKIGIARVPNAIEKMREIESRPKRDKIKEQEEIVRGLLN
ncbi:hypothetical protein [Desulfovibrio sp. 6_1_46AFAA]|uniref:hypothetical protein n=1 Tax=Desulfovibrio sp. 6_1_46AFAA TaxID=665942 RepID=UPI0012E9EA15|nr:hypothetical protein [Desulfovibrio sp. 6_1_46AFAA]